MDKRTIEGIESCRPHSDDVLSPDLRDTDLSDPDLSDVLRAVQNDPDAHIAYQRVQGWDAAISGAMDRVSVPPGLADRILNRLNAAAASGSPPDRLANVVEVALKSADGVPAADTVEVQPPRSQWSRRRWLGLGAASTIAAAVLVAAYSGWLHPAPGDSLEAMADDWSRELDERSAGWQDIEHAPPDFAIPGSIMATPTGWQRIGKYTTGRGIAFELVNAQGQKARLYVVRLSQAGLPAIPPGAPQSTTGGKAVGYWQTGRVIYVLAVPGDERTYRTFVRTSPTPFA